MLRSKTSVDGKRYPVERYILVILWNDVKQLCKFEMVNKLGVKISQKCKKFSYTFMYQHFKITAFQYKSVYLYNRHLIAVYFTHLNL